MRYFNSYVLLLFLFISCKQLQRDAHRRPISSETAGSLAGKGGERLAVYPEDFIVNSLNARFGNNPFLGPSEGVAVSFAPDLSVSPPIIMAQLRYFDDQERVKLISLSQSITSAYRELLNKYKLQGKLGLKIEVKLALPPK